MNASFTIRKTEIRDAEAVLDCRRAAVIAKASYYYGPELTEVWGAKNDGLIDKVRQEIMDADFIHRVADHPVDGVLGFGIVIPRQSELRAVYVRPNSYGKVGAEILISLLKEAKARGCVHLEGDSSVNAEKFYLQNGFRILSRGMHEMESGKRMDCLKIWVDL